MKDIANHSGEWLWRRGRSTIPLRLDPSGGSIAKRKDTVAPAGAAFLVTETATANAESDGYRPSSHLSSLSLPTLSSSSQMKQSWPALDQRVCVHVCVHVHTLNVAKFCLSPWNFSFYVPFGCPLPCNTQVNTGVSVRSGKSQTLDCSAEGYLKSNEG